MSHSPIQKLPGSGSLSGLVIANGVAAPSALLCNLSAVTDPTVNSDSVANYSPGSIWVNNAVTPARIWQCASNGAGAAVWVPLRDRVYTDTGAANALVVNIAPEANAYFIGMFLRVIVSNANTTASTINVSGFGAKTIKKAGTQDLANGDIAAGSVIFLVYDGTNFQLVSGSGSSSSGENYAVTGGGPTAYTLTLPNYAAYTTGSRISFQLNVTSTGAATININGFGAKSLTKQSTNSLDVGDLQINTVYQAIYDGTEFQIVSPYGNSPVSPNLAANGGMRLWQRGTAFVSGNAGNMQYTADRWGLYNNALGRSVSRISSGLPFGAKHSLRVQRDAGNTAVNAIGMIQAWTSRNSTPLQGKTITISFYGQKGADFSAASNFVTLVIDTGTGIDQSAVNETNGAWTGQVVTSVAFALTPNFVRYSTTLTVPTNATQIGFRMQSNPVGTAGTNDWFEFTNFMVSEGAALPSFELPDEFVEQVMCKPFCQKSYSIGVNPGTSTVEGAQIQGYVENNTFMRNLTVPLEIEMRAPPTLTLYSYTGAGGSPNGYIRDMDAGVDRVVIAVSVGTKGFAIQASPAAFVVGNRLQGHYLAEAEL